MKQSFPSQALDVFIVIINLIYGNNSNLNIDIRKMYSLLSSRMMLRLKVSPSCMLNKFEYWFATSEHWFRRHVNAFLFVHT